MCFLDFIGALFGWDKDDEEVEEKEQPKYTIKKSQMSECEKYFYDILTKHFSSDYDIRPQVPLSSIIEKEKSFSREYQNELNRVIDFGIFNRENSEPLLLIEINDKTHNQSSRKERDKKVQSICNSAGIKLITFWTKFDNKEDYIVNRVIKEINEIINRQ